MTSESKVACSDEAGTIIADWERSVSEHLHWEEIAIFVGCAPPFELVGAYETFSNTF